MNAVTGYWIVKGYVCGESEFECSACHGTEWRTSIARFKFCPFCGVQMSGVVGEQIPVQIYEREDNNE